MLGEEYNEAFFNNEFISLNLKKSRELSTSRDSFQTVKVELCICFDKYLLKPIANIILQFIETNLMNYGETLVYIHEVSPEGCANLTIESCVEYQKTHNVSKTLVKSRSCLLNMLMKTDLCLFYIDNMRTSDLNFCQSCSNRYAFKIMDIECKKTAKQKRKECQKEQDISKKKI